MKMPNVQLAVENFLSVTYNIRGIPFHSVWAFSKQAYGDMGDQIYSVCPGSCGTIWCKFGSKNAWTWNMYWMAWTALRNPLSLRCFSCNPGSWCLKSVHFATIVLWFGAFNCIQLHLITFTLDLDDKDGFSVKCSEIVYIADNSIWNTVKNLWVGDTKRVGVLYNYSCKAFHVLYWTNNNICHIHVYLYVITIETAFGGAPGRATVCIGSSGCTCHCFVRATGATAQSDREMISK